MKRKQCKLQDIQIEKGREQIGEKSEGDNKCAYVVELRDEFKKRTCTMKKKQGKSVSYQHSVDEEVAAEGCSHDDVAAKRETNAAVTGTRHAALAVMVSCCSGSQHRGRTT